MARVTGPAYDGYFADPFVLRLPDGRYAAYGTGRPPAPTDATDATDATDGTDAGPAAWVNDWSTNWGSASTS